MEQNEALTHGEWGLGRGLGEGQTQKYVPLCSIKDYKLVEGREG